MKELEMQLEGRRNEIESLHHDMQEKEAEYESSRASAEELCQVRVAWSPSRGSDEVDVHLAIGSFCIQLSPDRSHLSSHPMPAQQARQTLHEALEQVEEERSIRLATEEKLEKTKTKLADWRTRYEEVSGRGGRRRQRNRQMEGVRRKRTEEIIHFHLPLPAASLAYATTGDGGAESS
jgi:hypothetical protein